MEEDGELTRENWGWGSGPRKSDLTSGCSLVPDLCFPGPLTGRVPNSSSFTLSLSPCDSCDSCSHILAF